MSYWVTWNVNENIQNGIGIVATVSTLCFFLAPSKTFLGIIKKGSTEGFRGEGFMLTFFNCTLWVLYSLYQGSRLMPLVCNSAGAVLAVVYIFLFAMYLPRSNSKASGGEINPAAGGAPTAYTTPQKYLFQFFITIALLGLVGGLVNLDIFDFDIADQNFPAFVFGLIADVFNILMYGAPLTVMKLVIRTKSVKFMPFLVSFFTLTNSIAWLAYGLYVGDIWITVPNASGFLLGISQLILYSLYCRNSDVDSATEDEDEERYKPIHDDGSEEYTEGTE